MIARWGGLLQVADYYGSISVGARPSGRIQSPPGDAVIHQLEPDDK